MHQRAEPPGHNNMISFEFLTLPVHLSKEPSNGHPFSSPPEKKKEKKEEFSNSKELFPTSRRTEQYFFLSSMSSIVIFYDRVGLTAALQARTVLLAITTRKDFGDLLVTCSLCFQLI